MAFNLFGAITGAIEGAVIGFVRSGTLYGAAIGAVAGFAVGGFLFSALITVPKVPSDARQTGKAYSADLQQNTAALGDVKAVGVGRWRDWYNYRAQPYKENVDHAEVLHAYLHVTVGTADIEGLLIGDSPIETFSGYAVEILPPGSPMTLFHPNVYTNNAVEGLELQGGTNGIVRNATVSFTADDKTMRATTNIYQGRAFAGLAAGQQFVITGSVSNDGTYTIVKSGRNQNGLAFHEYAIVVETLIDETDAEVTITVNQDSDDAETVESEERDGDGNEVSLQFDADLSEVRMADEGLWDGWLQDFRVGDTVGVRNTPTETSDNDGIDFTVVSTNGSTVLGLTPAPVDLLTHGTIFLKRRREGPYFAAPPGEKAEGIGIDITFDALGRLHGDDVEEAGVTFEARYRPVDDSGYPTGDWTSIVFGYTDSSLKNRRYSYYIPLDPPIRPQVDLTRLSIDEAKTTVYDDAQWNGLRGYLAPRALLDENGDPVLDEDDNPVYETPNVDVDSTTVAVRIRASGQLNAVSQKKINGTQTKFWPVYDGSTWTEQPTANPAWNTIGWLIQESAGTLSYADFDLPKWLSFAQDCDERGDECNGVVVNQRQLWDCAQALMRTARAKLYRNPTTGQLEPYRDEPVAASVMFCDGINGKFGADKIETPDANAVSGVMVKFVDPNLWTERDPGPLAGNADDPREVEFEFCTSWQKAWEEAWYEWQCLRYRVQTFSINVEMEGFLAGLGSRVLLASAPKGWGQGAQLLEVSGNTLTVWPAPFWTTGMQHHVYLQDPEGVPGAKILCSRGAQDDQIVLASAPDVELREDGDGQFPTLIAFGHDGSETVPADAPIIAIVESGEASGLRSMTLSVIVEDDRVHDAAPTAPVDPYDMAATEVDLSLHNFQLRQTVLAKPPALDTYRIYVDWDSVAGTYDTPIYETYWRVVGDAAWTFASRSAVPASQFELDAASQPNLEIRMRASVTGYLGPYLTKTWPHSGMNVYVLKHNTVTTGTAEDQTSIAVLAIDTGYTGARTYSWVKISGGAVTVSDAAGSNVTFSASGLAVGETRTSVWVCTVTDDNGPVQSIPSTISFTRTA